MKKLLAGFWVAALFLLLAPVTDADEMFSLKAAFITLNPEGRFGATASGINGTRMDVDQTLGLGRSYSGMVEGAVQLEDFRLSASYLPLDFSGTKTLNQTVSFNGQSYASGSSVTSRLNADVYDVSLTYFVANFDDIPTRIQLGVETSVKAIDAEVKMSSSGLNLAEKNSAIIPIPTIGLHGRIALADFVGLVVRAGGMGYSGNRFIDGEAQIEFSPIPLVGLHAGYRYIDLKLDRSGVFADLSFSGPFLGAFIRF